MNTIDSTTLVKKVQSMIYTHVHTDSSNLRLPDCTNRFDRVIDTVVNMGMRGVAITDHESLSAHVKALRYVKEGKEKGKIPKDFKLILGNEIYLVDSLEEVRDNYTSGETRFYHFVLMAKDKIGHDQLRKLSSKAWSNSFKTGQMERVPTVKADVEAIAKGRHLIATTACLGGEFAQYIFQLIEAEASGNEELIQSKKIKIHEFVVWCMETFGKENFFIELQPSAMEEQKLFNKKAVHIANAYGLRCTVATDAHYLTIEDRPVHEAYLKSKEGEREVADFYESTYFMPVEEIFERLDYLSTDTVNNALQATLDIGDMVEEYDLYHPVVVPKIKLPKFEVSHIFKKYYDLLPYIKSFAYSDDEQDRYYLHLVEEGIKEKEPITIMSVEEFEKRAMRINMELKELWEITEVVQTKISSYYITTREIINIMWEDGDSLVGVARGSVTG